MGNFLDKSCRPYQTFILLLIAFPEGRDIYENMWKNMGQPDRPHVTL